MTAAVLDASAVLALILGEPGKDQIEAVIENCVIAAVNLTEVVGYLCRNGADERTIREMLTGLQLAVVAFDAELGYAAGILEPVTRSAGLSLGDRACLSLARRLGVKALTTDRSWLRVSSAAEVDVELIR